jgi:serine/threonine protein phosphatase PrpC
MVRKTGRLISASIKGANHADKGISCQDAATSAILFHKGYKFYFMAVADGHGGASYTRSDIGSFLALQAASEAVNRFIIYVIDVMEKYPDNWVDMVREDFSSRFGKMLVSNWIRMVESHANEEVENNPTDIIKLYGTTISLAIVINDNIFIGKIGDSSVYNIIFKNKKHIVNNLFETDDSNNNLGLETSSLCSRDAYRKWQIQSLTVNEEIKMIFMSTDGFVDSLKEPQKEIFYFYKFMIKKGIVNFERTIEERLKLISDKGVGDDISLVIFLPGLQRKV